MWPRASFQFGSLPAKPLYARVVKIDRDFQLAIDDAIFTGGASRSYVSYISDAQVLASVQKNVAQQVAADYGYTGVERFYSTDVRPLPTQPGDYVVDFCVDSSRWTPPTREPAASWCPSPPAA